MKINKQRVTLFLTVSQINDLKKLAQTQEVSYASLVRKSVADLLSKAKRQGKI